MSVSLLTLSFCRDSPARPPDWRWQAAAALAARKQRFPHWTWPPGLDPLVRTLLAARHGYRVSGVTPTNVAAVRAAVAWAETAPEVVRIEVQARLLASQTDAEIERKTGVPASVVGRYEQLLYHCRDRLGCPSFIAHAFLNVTTELPTMADALRQVAYHGGPHVLDLCLDVLRDGIAGRDVRPSTAPRSADEWAATAIRAGVRATLAWRLVGPQRYTPAAVKALCDPRPAEPVPQLVDENLALPTRRVYVPAPESTRVARRRKTCALAAPEPTLKPRRRNDLRPTAAVTGVQKVGHHPARNGKGEKS